MLPDGFARFPVWRRWFGRRSERAAAKFLRRRRYRILGRNVDDRLGEIDVLALDGETLVVVEVRSSETRSFDELAKTVDVVKQKRLTDAILRFLQKRRMWDVGVRFDVLALRWPPGAQKPEVQHYRNAFQAVGKYQFHS